MFVLQRREPGDPSLTVEIFPPVTDSTMGAGANRLDSPWHISTEVT